VSVEVVKYNDSQEEFNNAIREQVDKGGDSFVPLNNKCTLHMLAAARDLSLSIPADIKLVSFDDSESFQHMNPPISALRQPVIDIGLKSVARLYERIKETKDPGKHFLLPCEFIERGSH